MSSGRYNLRARRSKPTDHEPPLFQQQSEDSKRKSAAPLLRTLTLNDVKRKLYDVAADVTTHFQDTVEKLTPTGAHRKARSGKKRSTSKQSKNRGKGESVSAVQFSDGEY